VGVQEVMRVADGVEIVLEGREGPLGTRQIARLEGGLEGLQILGDPAERIRVAAAPRRRGGCRGPAIRFRFHRHGRVFHAGGVGDALLQVAESLEGPRQVGLPQRALQRAGTLLLRALGDAGSGRIRLGRCRGSFG
jgi:hypothetical protein